MARKIGGAGKIAIETPKIKSIPFVKSTSGSSRNNRKTPAGKDSPFFYDMSQRYLDTALGNQFKIPTIFSKRPEFVTRLKNTIPRLNQAKSGQAHLVPIETIKQNSLEVAKLEAGFTVIRTLIEFTSGPKPKFFDPIEKGIRQFAEEYRRVQDGLIILDTNLPGSSFAHLRTIDHHGHFATADGKNSTMKLLDLFRKTLKDSKLDMFAQRDAQIMMEQDTSLRDAANGDPIIAAAIIKLNIKKATSDNLADGGEGLWIARNQGKVLQEMQSGGKLPELLYQTSQFIDFNAFGNNYQRGDASVELGAALLYQYGQILAKNGIKTSDRFPSELAETIMGEATQKIDQMIKDPQARTAAAKAFWKEVDTAKIFAAESSVLATKINGRPALTFYDLSKSNHGIKLSDFSVFAQWLSIPELQRQKSSDQKLPIQVSLSSMPPVLRDNGSVVKRSLPIIAIPNGLKSQHPQRLLAILPALNKAELAKAKSLGLEASKWFGKENVVLPNPGTGGSFLSPKEIRAIILNPEAKLLGDNIRLDARADIPEGGSLKMGPLTINHDPKAGYWAVIENGSHFTYTNRSGLFPKKIESKDGMDGKLGRSILLSDGDILTLPGGSKIRIHDSRHHKSLVETTRKVTLRQEKIYQSMNARLRISDGHHDAVLTPLNKGLPKVYIGNIYLDAAGKLTRSEVVPDYFLSAQPVKLEAQARNGEFPIRVVLDQRGNILDFDRNTPWFKDKQWHTIESYYQSPKNALARHLLKQNHPYLMKLIERRGESKLLIDLMAITQQGFSETHQSRMDIELDLALHFRNGRYVFNRFHSEHRSPKTGSVATLKLKLTRGDYQNPYNLEYSVASGALPKSISEMFKQLQTAGNKK